jgi:hypothetical protein
VRALVVTQNITVDGSIEMLGDWFDPQAISQIYSRSCTGRTAEVTRSSPAVKPSRICAATGQSSRTIRVASRNI